MTCGTGLLEEQAAGGSVTNAADGLRAVSRPPRWASRSTVAIRPSRPPASHVSGQNQAFVKRLPDSQLLGGASCSASIRRCRSIGVSRRASHWTDIQSGTHGVLTARANARLHHESRCPDERRSARPCHCAPSRHSRGRPHASGVGHWDDRAGRCEGARKAATARGPGHMFRGDRGRVGGDRSLWSDCLCRYSADSRDRDSSGARGNPGEGLSSYSGRGHSSCSLA